MPRRRGVARKSFARRRIRRVKKYDHNVLPVRMKLQMSRMAALLEDELADSVGLEPFVEAELTVKGVPTDEWQYYEGFAKRMLRLYRHFTGETLQLEKASLIEEYVLRGYNRDVLEQTQGVIEWYAPPDVVKLSPDDWGYFKRLGEVWLADPELNHGGGYFDR